MMNIEEVVLGFDARIIYLENETFWNYERRNHFLFRLDILQPFSTDSMVWPSIWDLEKFSKPSYVGFYQDLWEDLDELQRHLDLIKNKNLHSFFTIAITLFYGLCDVEEKQNWDKLLRGVSPTQESIEKQVLPIIYSKPPVRDKSWLFLGYDVSDQWGFSVLSNCGFNPTIDDILFLRSRWGYYLNQRHLFNELDDAVEFKNISNKRIEEHAPFFVFGIWLIEERVGCVERA